MKYNTLMKFIELTVHTTSEASELVCDVLWEYTEGGVAVSDYADVVALQSGKNGVYWDYLDEALQTEGGDVLVKAFLDPARADEIPAIMQKLYDCRDRGGLNFGTLEETKREIEGDDWIDVWKKHFRPIHLGRIVVVPEWIEYRKQADEQVILLDSNMAFGTGEHETTAMCAELIQETLKEGDVVLDVGCGSGILGIAAAKLGAKLCYLTDIDPVAVASAKHNAARNGVEGKTVVTEADLIGDAAVKADLLVANITGEILARLAPAVPACLNEGGRAILSGVIESRLPLVIEAYKRAGLAVQRQMRRGEWYALVLGR